jgi:hypothetical protein
MELKHRNVNAIMAVLRGGYFITMAFTHCIYFTHSSFFSTHHSWRILDLSVAMAYAMLSVYGKKKRSISAAAALFEDLILWAHRPKTNVVTWFSWLLADCRRVPRRWVPIRSSRTR